MRFLFFLLIRLKLIFCLITKEMISESNQTIFNDSHLEFSIVNPIFGQLFTHRMLENLIMFYYFIEPAYINDFNRDYSKDKHTDCLSKFLIKLFPSPGGNLATTTQGISNISRRFFGIENLRFISIKIFAKLFVNILKLENNKCLYNLEDLENSNIYRKKYKELLYKFALTKKDIAEFEKNKENLVLVLLTIHSFMLDILNTKEEYELYVTTIVKHIKRSDLTKVKEYFLKDITYIDEQNHEITKFEYDILTEDNLRLNTYKKVLNLVYEFKRDIYPYRKDSPPTSNALVPFYLRAENKYDLSNKFPDCVEITILHLCNIFFYEEKSIFDVEHLMLDEDSDLLNFYKKYNTPFEITYEVRKDWAKVLQCLDDIPCKSKHNENLGKIFYIRTHERNEIKSCLMNIITVLCKICISKTNNILKDYIKLFDGELKSSTFVNSFETFLNLLVNNYTKIYCAGENLKRDNNFVYGFITLQIEDSTQKSITKLQFNVKYNHSFATFLDRKSKYTYVQKNNICIASGSNLSPIDYLLLGYLQSITETSNQKYEASMLDKMFNTQNLISNEIKRKHLFLLYNLLNESEFDKKIFKTSELIVKSTPLEDIATFNLFVPFMIKIDSLKKLVNKSKLIIKTWKKLLIIYNFEQENTQIMKIWDNIITNTDLSNQTIGFFNFCTQKLLYGLTVLAKTNIKILSIEEIKVGRYNCEKISKAIQKILTLEKLTLTVKQCKSEDLMFIKEIFTNKENNIITLDLIFHDGEVNFLDILGKALCDKNNKILHLNLSQNSLQPDDGLLLRNILQHENNKVTHLNLASNNLGIVGTKYICEAFKSQNNKITHLNLSYNEIDTEGVKHLSKALSHKYNNITSLCLTDNNIKDEGIEYMCKALICKDKKITSLNLSGNEIRDEGISFLCNLIRSKNNNLQFLCLDECYITIKGIKLLSEVLIDINNQLISLNLAKNYIKEIGAKYLSNLLKHKNNNIKELDICQNNIKDVGVKYICDGLNNENNKLVNLNLASNNINPKGVKSVCTALKNSNNKLRVLNLNCNNIKPVGAKYIRESTSSRFNVLDKIHLYDCNLGIQGYDVLSENNNIKTERVIKISMDDGKFRSDKFKFFCKTETSNTFFRPCSLEEQTILRHEIYKIEDCLSNNN